VEGKNWDGFGRLKKTNQQEKFVGDTDPQREKPYRDSPGGILMF